MRLVTLCLTSVVLMSCGRSTEAPKARPEPKIASTPQPADTALPESDEEKEQARPMEPPANVSAPRGAPSIKFVRKVKTGSLPKGVVVSPDATKLFVTNFGRVKSWNVFAYDRAALKRTGMIVFEGNGVEMAFLPDGKRLLVSNFKKNLVMEADVETLQVVRTFPVGKNPKTIAVAGDGKRAYVSNWTSDSITAMDLESGKVLGHVYTGNQPRGIAVSPDGKTIYVSHCAGGTVTFVDADSLEVTHQLKLSKNRQAGLRHIAVSPDGGKLYVTGMKVGLLFVIDTKTKEITGRAKIGSGPKTVDITPDGRYAFTADFSGDTITAVNLSTLESAKFRQKEILEPCGLAVSPDGKTLYVTGWKTSLLGEYKILPPQ